jgi:hypothetical protein
MTGVALLDRSFDQASAPEYHAVNRGFPLHPSPKKACRHEFCGLGS